MNDMFIESNSWHDIWEAKGNMPGTKEDIRKFEGYENSSAQFAYIAQRISETLELHPNDKLLEVGCAAGALSQYLTMENYPE
jgi:cyclopropane fatty-acyl-phospholipid synthase-like methyltransferase